MGATSTKMAPRTPEARNLPAPGYRVEVHRNPANFGVLIRNGNETSLNDVFNNVERVCPHLGTYSIQWMQKNHENSSAIMFVLRNVKTKKRAGFALCAVRSNSLYINIICAREKGAGAGKSLIRAIEEEARRMGLRYVELTSLRFGPTIQFYKKMGYTRGPPNATSVDTTQARRLYKKIQRLVEVYEFTGTSKTGYKAIPRRGSWTLTNKNRARMKNVTRQVGEITPYLTRHNYASWNNLTDHYPEHKNLKFWNNTIYSGTNWNEAAEHLPKYHKKISQT